MSLILTSQNGRENVATVNIQIYRKLHYTLPERLLWFLGSLRTDHVEESWEYKSALHRVLKRAQSLAPHADRRNGFAMASQWLRNGFAMVVAIAIANFEMSKHHQQIAFRAKCTNGSNKFLLARWKWGFPFVKGFCYPLSSPWCSPARILKTLIVVVGDLTP